MRALFAAGLAGVAVASLAACNKPAPSAGAVPVTLSAAPAAPAGPQAAAQPPHRKAGLWRQTMAMEGVDRAMPATELCLDDASQARLSMVGKQMSNYHCLSRFNRNLDGSFSFSSSCDMGPNGHSDTHGTITGDFNSSYKVEVDSKITGGPAPAANGEHKMTLTATWLGPCAPGQKGGDMIMANGMKMNMLDRPGAN